MRCPLPIDWLEYLEGAASGDFASHLRECRPCQLLVEELRRQVPGRPRLRLLRVPAADSWPRWQATQGVSPSLGEIWWSRRTSQDSERAPFLIVSDAWAEGGRSWCDVVPIST